MKASLFGASVSTLNRFELLFMFVSKLQKISKIYLDNVAVQTSIENFKEVIKEVAKKKDAGASEE